MLNDRVKIFIRNFLCLAFICNSFIAPSIAQIIVQFRTIRSLVNNELGKKTWKEEDVAKFEEVLLLSNRRTDKEKKRRRNQCAESVYDSMLIAQASKIRSSKY
jgi:hypothetical protein